MASSFCEPADKTLGLNIFARLDFPFVAFGRTEGPCNFPFVDEDSEYGMHLIVDIWQNQATSGLGLSLLPKN